MTIYKLHLFHYGILICPEQVNKQDVFLEVLEDQNYKKVYTVPLEIVTW